MDSSSLELGLAYEFKFKIPENNTVPFFYPESPEFQVMPKVFATGFMVGLFEWACIKAINPYLDFPVEQTIGTDVRLNHSVSTPPGLTIKVKTKLEKIEGRKLTFSIIADDGVEKISKGTRERFIIDTAKFNSKAEAKAKSVNN